MVEARDGRTAIEGAQSYRPQVVVQEARLPDCDGVELAGRLVEESGGDVAVIALVGTWSTLADSPEGRLRFTEFLHKPVQAQRLRQVVAAAMPAGVIAGGDSRAKTPLGEVPRVLVVDDSPGMRRLIAETLTTEGYRVDTARDGREALALLADAGRQGPPDAVVSDVLMPGIDGFQLCRALRGERGLEGLPIVLMTTAYVEEADAELALSVGADAFVSRGQDYQAVVAALREALARDREGEDAPERTQRTLDPALHRDRLAAQLERQSTLRIAAGRRADGYASALSALASAAQSLEGAGEVEEGMQEALERYLDSGLLSSAAVYLAAPGAELRLTARAGDIVDAAAVESFFGRMDVLRNAQADWDVLLIPSERAPTGRVGPLLSDARASAMLLAPLRTRDRHHGILTLATNQLQPAEGLVAFGRGAQAQISGALAARWLRGVAGRWEEHIREMGPYLPTGLVVTDEGDRIETMNSAAQRMTGYSEDAAHGLILDELLNRQGEADSWSAQVQHIDGRRVVDVRGFTHTSREPKGRVRRTHVLIPTVIPKTHEATEDPLTRTMTPRPFAERLEREVALSAAHGGGGAVLLVKLTGVGEVYRKDGHAIGDRVLSRVAQALRARLRRTDALGRIDEDAFAVLCPGLDGPAAVSVAEDLRKVAARAPAEDRLPSPDIHVGAVAFASPAAPSPSELLDQARSAARMAERAEGRSVCLHGET